MNSFVVGSKITIPAGTPIHIAHSGYSFTLPGPLEIEVADWDSNEYGSGPLFELSCDVADYRLPELPRDMLEAIPGRPGWRRDGDGREWYSDAWLDNVA
jgi:hypothetical protein